MANSSIIWTLRINHLNYSNNICPDMSVSPCPQTLDLMNRHGYMLRKVRIGEWILLHKYNNDGMIVNGRYRFYVESKYKMLHYITAPGILVPEKAILLKVDNANSSVEIPKETFERMDVRPGIILVIDIQLHDSEKGMFTTDIQLPVAEYYWEYLFIKRNSEVQGKFAINDSNNTLFFDAGKEIEYQGMKALLFRSLTKIPCSESYTGKLNFVEEMGDRTREVLSQLPFPQPGKFLDAPPDALRMILYM